MGGGRHAGTRAGIWLACSLGWHTAGSVGSRASQSAPQKQAWSQSEACDSQDSKADSDDSIVRPGHCQGHYSTHTPPFGAVKEMADSWERGEQGGTECSTVLCLRVPLHCRAGRLCLLPSPPSTASLAGPATTPATHLGLLLCLSSHTPHTPGYQAKLTAGQTNAHSPACPPQLHPPSWPPPTHMHTCAHLQPCPAQKMSRATWFFAQPCFWHCAGCLTAGPRSKMHYAL